MDGERGDKLMKTSSRYVACAVLALTVTVLVGSVQAVPVLPNGPIDRDVFFTLGNDVLGFDRSVGTLGALVSMPSSADGGRIEPSSSKAAPAERRASSPRPRSP